MTITAGKVTQVDEVRSGGSYLSQHDLRLHFGLGRHPALNRSRFAGRPAWSRSFPASSSRWMQGIRSWKERESFPTRRFGRTSPPLASFQLVPYTGIAAP